MYQVVPTIGSDGKKLLQLLPISKSSGNLIPVVQSPVMSHGLKANTEKPVQEVELDTTYDSANLHVKWILIPLFAILAIRFIFYRRLHL